MVSQKILVQSVSGLHLRPASLLSQEALNYKSHITLINGTKIVNAKSVLGVLGACVKGGMEIEIQCEGEDEEKALVAICNLLNTEFEKEKEQES